MVWFSPLDLLVLFFLFFFFLILEENGVNLKKEKTDDPATEETKLDDPLNREQQ